MEQKDVAPEKVYLTWNAFDSLVSQIADAMTADYFMPDLILGIARGGLIPAVALSHRFNCPILPVNISLRDKKSHGGSLGNLLVYEKNLQGMKVLIVDDICDSGATFQEVADRLEHHEVDQKAHIKYASLYYKQTSLFTPNYVGRKMGVDEDAWIVFPWEN